MKIYDINSFPYDDFARIPIQKRKQGNPATRKKIKYLDVIAAFDIETYNDPEILQAYMYIWQMQIGSWTIIGHYWEEYLQFLNNLSLALDDDIYMVIFVHNLSFEFSFLKGIYDFQIEEVFAVDSRKVLKCEMLNHFEYRCSYLQSNMSLDQFTQKMGVAHAKLSGDDFDYSVQRFPWTVLSDQELQYCINDVLGLVESMRIQMDLENDNLYSIPLTSTGYVRRDVKKAMRSYNRQALKNQLPEYNVFQILREAFRGGNTHANRYFADLIVDNVQSFDRVSSYPDVQLNHKFPMSPWLEEPVKDLTLDQVIRRIDKHGRACLMRCWFRDMRLSDPLIGCPYIPTAKCRNLIQPKNDNVSDNGRVLKADYLEISLTDVDLKIIVQQYTFSEMGFIDFYHSRYAKLPLQLRETVKQYFIDKTSLKNVAGQELYYMKSKNKLNSIYGMSVQSPVKQSIDYVDFDFQERSDPEIDLLEESNRKAFQSYAWGVWVTAWARWELQLAIDLCGDQFVYCDTDSVKFYGDVDFTGYNRIQQKMSIKNGAFADDPGGVRHYLGVYELDGVYSKFVTMGAKKYAYEFPDGSIGITVAGVNKKRGAVELAAAGGLEKFKDGFIFKDGGGTESVYNDMQPGECQRIVREGRIITVTSNVYIRESEYTLGVTGEYHRILDDAKIWRNLFKEERLTL